MYRPKPEEIFSLFNDYELINSECLTAKGYLKENIKKIILQC